MEKKYSKKLLNSLFEKDFENATTFFKKHYKKKLPQNIEEVLIEMVFQLGIKNLLKFKKFNFFLKANKPYLSALEMLNSLWYSQTPKRVDGLIKTLLKQKT